MPYVLVNDKSSPVRYYRGPEFGFSKPTAVEAEAQPMTLTEASRLMVGRGDLYAVGWRVMFVSDDDQKADSD